MFRIIRICAVVGTIAILSPVHNTPGGSQLPDRGEAVASIARLAQGSGGVLGEAGRSLVGDPRDSLRDFAVAEVSRRVAALEEVPSRDTLTASDRYIPWRGPPAPASR